MAALQLLPRELLSLLARQTSSYSSLNAGSFRASSCARQNLDSLLLLQWPRYRHKSSFDPALAREFDRPEAGFDFPGERLAAGQASFMEEEGSEYAMLSPSRSSTTRARSSKLSQTSSISSTSVAAEASKDTRSRNVEAHAYVMRIRNVRKLQTSEEILDMLAWFEHAPSLSSFIGDTSSRDYFTRYTAAVRHVSRKLVTLFPGDIELLMRYASIAARKGFAIKIPVDFFAHISRFSAFERLEPFLSTFTERTRRYAERFDFSAQNATEAGLRFVGNSMIRAQVLSARHVDALNMLRKVRQLDLGRRRDGISTSVKPVEPFTYQLLAEEFSRNGVHSSLLKELAFLHKRDYTDHLLPTSAMQESDSASKPLHVAGEKSVAVPRSFTRVGREEKARTLYLRLKGDLMNGRLPSQEELGVFRQACVSQGQPYLFRAFSRSLQTPKLVALHLRQEMQEGRLPSTKVLARFIDGCMAAKCPEVAHDLGKWMGQQSPRFQSLWRVARMYRLVETGKVHNARLALRIFVDSFMMLGVPVQVQEAAEQQRFLPQLADDVLPAKPKERLWPSTHGITTAIRALFVQNKTPSYLIATYRSFIEASYASGASLPLSSLPDQVSYDAFIQPLSKVGEPDMALEIMHDMRNRGLMPNRHNWDTLIGGYAAYGRLDMVEAILSRMEKQVDVERTKLVEQKVISQGLSTQPAFFTQAAVDHAHHQGCASNHPLDVFEIPTPRLGTYTTVLRGLGIAGKTVAAEKYRLRLYKATKVSGARLYRPGENIRTTKALEILASMDAFSAQRQRRLEM